jgi:hypothetical protein
MDWFGQIYLGRSLILMPMGTRPAMTATNGPVRPNLSRPIAYPDAYGDTPGHDGNEWTGPAKFISADRLS